jgi:hypothetical protein
MGDVFAGTAHLQIESFETRGFKVSNLDGYL